MEKDTIFCACGCGLEISKKGANGKPRRYEKGHQTKGRVYPKDESYWAKRLHKLNNAKKKCACGCGGVVSVSMEWLQERKAQRNVWLPKYKKGHEPVGECACGCGTQIVLVDERGVSRGYFGKHGGRAYKGGSTVDWASRTSEWNKKAPECACGCGSLIVRSESQLRAYNPIPVYLPGHNARKGCVRVIDPVEMSVILGTLMGDMSIVRPHPTTTPRLEIGHSVRQREYLLHKMEILNRFMWKWEVRENRGYGEGHQVMMARSSCMPAFEEIWGLVRPKGCGKVVTESWLGLMDERSIAYWYMDDGSLVRVKQRIYGAKFHTEGFSEKENALLASWLVSKGVEGAVVRKRGRYFFVKIPKKGVNRLFDMVSPYIHQTMKYKIGEELE